MNKAKKALAVECMVFVFLFSLASAGALTPVIGKIFYYLSFIVPIPFMFLLKSEMGLTLEMPTVKPGKKIFALTAWFAVPTVSLVFLVAFLSSLLTTLMGAKQNLVDLPDNVFLAIFLHALLPAVLEEGLFRFIPISLLGRYSKKYTVFISAALFALMHFDLTALPYAFVAGLVFAYIDIVSGSIIPSLILHFLNNMLSVFYTRSGGSALFFGIIIALGVVSSISLLLFGKHCFVSLKSDKCEQKLSIPILIVVILALLTAVLNFIGRF